MKTSIVSLTLCLAMLLSALSRAAEQSSQQLFIGISFSIPPYVIADENDGLERDILRKAFAVKGYTVRPSYLPLARTFMSFEEGSLDGVINVKPGMVSGFHSDVVITFKNKAISLAENKIEIDSLEDLSDRSIVAFQRASHILGPEFSSIVKNNSDYFEVADQSLQVKQLFRDRTQVVIMEEKIFQYFRRWLFERSQSLQGEYIVTTQDLLRPVVYHDIFPPSEYRFSFLSEKVRDDFNVGLKTIRENGTYDAILKKYDQSMAIP